MAVHLLPKSELVNLKAKEKSREIQEGVKIATRIDGLRELWAKTEQDFETYKTATLGAIQKEISELSVKKDELSEELRQMQSKYDSLMPDIKVKRSELAQFEKSLTAWEKKLGKQKDDIELLEIDVLEAKNKSEDAKVRMEENERISRILLRDSDEKKQQAQVTLETAKTIQENAYRLKKETEDALDLRENSIKAKEQELSSKELSIMNDRKELEAEKIKVNDTRETLERSLERLRQGRRA